MVTAAAFTALVLAVAIQRLTEVRRSRSHARALLLRGAREHATWQVPALALLHSAWLVSSLVEVWWLETTPRLWLSVGAVGLYATGQWLRVSAMQALGDRWTIGILTLPGEAPVTSGIYKLVRHPNYLGVILEIAALPLVHGAYRTAVAFSLANAVALAVRIHAEERALAADNAYLSVFAGRKRFLPTPGRREQG